jgi:hypothetical protein
MAGPVELIDCQKVGIRHRNNHYICTFKEFKSGRITLVRHCDSFGQPPRPWLGTEMELYPDGTTRTGVLAVLTLCKYVVRAKMTMTGVLLHALPKATTLFSGKAELESCVKEYLPSVDPRITMFRDLTIDEIIKFVAPYASWAVLDLDTVAYLDSVDSGCHCQKHSS